MGFLKSLTTNAIKIIFESKRWLRDTSCDTLGFKPFRASCLGWGGSWNRTGWDYCGLV